MPIQKSSPPLLEIERNDPNQGSRFAVRILAYRPASYLEDFPRFLQFSFKFFDRKEVRTPVATLAAAELQPGLSYPLKTNDGFLGETYEIDPSQRIKEQERFAEYLLEKCLCVEIWDAESLHYVGMVQIPLRDWLRQGRQIVQLGREYPVFDPSSRDSKGGLSVELTNQGRSVVPLEQQAAGDVSAEGYRMKKDGTKSRTKKKIKSRPMDLGDPKYRHMEAPP